MKIRVRVRVVWAGVPATAARMLWCKRSGGLDGAVAILAPPGGAQRSLETLIRTMRSLLHDLHGRAQHRGGFARAQVLLLEQHVSDAILLRHPAELGCQRVVQVLRG